MLFSDRLKLLRQREGFSQQKLALIIGFSQQSIGKWEVGTASPSPEIISNLADIFDVSTDYLLGRTNDPTPLSKQPFASLENHDIISKFSLLNDHGKSIIESVLDCELKWAEQQKQAKPKAAPPVEDTPTTKTKSIPVYFQSAAAGTGNFLDSESYDLVDIPIGDVPVQATFGVRVSGDSMVPDYLDGDIVFVKQQPTLESGEIGIFVIPLDGAVIKKYHKDDHGDRLLSLNPRYEPIVIREGNVSRIVGKVIGKLPGGIV